MREIEVLMQQRDAMLKQADAVANKVAGLEMAIAILSDQSALPTPPAATERLEDGRDG